ncbi:hypothetical protein [Nocardioides sp. URHA0020]|uniref:hypothetical protein n=1 Tax=Nocardioides sp. URHA0020 TaxID=1380392 RepID=UPI0012DEB959|nr:hypothetical protein [Nocardioides sp. URHA0020]
MLSHMPQPHAAVAGALAQALESQRPVRIVREDDWWAEDVRGLVVGLSGDWVVLQRLMDTVYIDGYEILRFRDVTEVDADDDDMAVYTERAIVGLGRPEVDFHLPPSASTPAILRAVADSAELVVIHTESIDEDALVIGHLCGIGTEDFDIQLVNAEGQWSLEPGRWRFEDVTRIAFDDRYSTALARFGDTRPTVIPGSAVDGRVQCSCVIAP